MEYELYYLLNVLGVAVTLMIIGYHFLGIDETQAKQEASANNK